MDGRKFDWIREQLGLSKVELARQLGISRQSLYPCIWEGPPRLVALAILGLWYQNCIGGLLEDPSEPEKDMTRKPKGRQGNHCAKRMSQNFCLKCNYRVHNCQPGFTEEATKERFHTTIVRSQGRLVFGGKQNIDRAIETKKLKRPSYVADLKKRWTRFEEWLPAAKKKQINTITAADIRKYLISRNLNPGRYWQLRPGQT